VLMMMRGVPFHLLLRPLLLLVFAALVCWVYPMRLPAHLSALAVTFGVLAMWGLVARHAALDRFGVQYMHSGAYLAVFILDFVLPALAGALVGNAAGAKRRRALLDR
jgi:hypothetical protein